MTLALASVAQASVLASTPVVCHAPFSTELGRPQFSQNINSIDWDKSYFNSLGIIS